ncbi:hypothetical protein [Hasllibacter sp. MH4015]|uniref:hypothetical protein n=1 Tax=Hasllibacter sp. MH4015 TaxID=2854029 RepID=UPI001CD7F0E3|nr:hypothetical protein [Hasllibacter sp. MH4015]
MNDQTPKPGGVPPLGVRLILWGLAGLGYLVMGLALSSALAALVFLWSGEMQTRWAADRDWQAVAGYAAGYGAVAMILGLPSFLVLAILPFLRWRRAYWIAVLAATAFVLFAYVMDA